MDFRILGSFELLICGRPVELTSPKQRALLVAGLLQANQVVSVARLVDAIWGENPPATAPALVHTYVSALRRVLRRPTRQPVIVTRSPGYVVSAEPHQLDLHRFLVLLERGRDAAKRGDHQAAATALRLALDQWHGPALDGLDSPLLRTEAVRLDELRIATVEERISAELKLGHLAPLAAELTGLVATYPLRETLRLQLMLVLHQLGRRAEALQVYQEGRDVLRRELGLDPNTELQRLHRAILRTDPSVLLPAPRETAVPPVPVPVAARRVGGADLPGAPAPPTDRRSRTGTPTPAQLPPPGPPIPGRDRALHEVCQALLSAGTAHRPVVCSISGRAGAGKTALALQAGHRVRQAFPDGQLFVSLRAGSHTADPRAALHRMLAALGVGEESLPGGQDEAAALLRSLLSGRRVLIVLDDAAGEAQVRPLLPAQPGCALLVTSRPALPGLDCQARLVVDALSEADAVVLLGRLAGEERIHLDSAAAVEIVRLCGNLPLAVRIIGARLAARRDWPLSVLANRLRDDRRRLDELCVGDLAVRSSLDLSYQAVPEPDRLALRRLGLLDVSDFAGWLLAPLARVPIVEGEQLAERLANARLLDHIGVGPDGHARYAIDDLVRLYARERAEAEEPADERARAVRRVLRCATDLALAARGCWLPNRAGHAWWRGFRRGTRYRFDRESVARLVRSPDDWLRANRKTLADLGRQTGGSGLTREARSLENALSSPASAVGADGRCPSQAPGASSVPSGRWESRLEWPSARSRGLDRADATSRDACCNT